MSHENTHYDGPHDPGPHTPRANTPADASLDARLTRILQGAVAAPADLTDRVYQASRHHLPAPQPVAQLASQADQDFQEHLTATLSPVPIPDGLTDRVYAASVRCLPGRLLITTPRHAASRSGWLRSRVVGGHLAMAASLALVACVGIWFAKMPAMPGGGSNVANNNPGRGTTTNGQAAGAGIHLASKRTPLTDSDWRLLEPVDHGQNEVRYLVETDSLSLESLSDELSAMLDQPGS